MTTQTANQVMQALFPLGLTVATPGALDAMEETQTNPAVLLRRHVSGDWGDLSQSDKVSNDQALTAGGRIFSAYRVTELVKFWVITEADRSATTILLPEEY